MIITAQDEQESVGDVIKLCKEEGLTHFWIPLRGANQALLNDAKVVRALRQKIVDVFAVLQSTQHIAVLHCAAGIHRTGTIAYTLLRLSG